MSYFNKIFGIYAQQNEILTYFLGKKHKFFKKDKRSDREILLGIEKKLNAISPDRIYNMVEYLFATSELHKKTFAGYKNKYQGKSIVLVGAGPSLNKFEPIKDAIYVGLNRAFKFDKVKFDYLFTIDQNGINQYYDEFRNYNGNNCIKFVGNQNGKGFRLDESYILSIENVKRYNTTHGLGLAQKFTMDIESCPLGNFATVSLQAMQFILYTNPKKIYLVGIDCNGATAGHFTGKTIDTAGRNERMEATFNKMVNQWHELKEFVSIYYPSVEIISVNPVGLKGLFKDIYTEEEN